MDDKELIEEFNTLIATVRTRLDSMRYAAPEMVTMHENMIITACADAEEKIREYKTKKFLNTEENN